MPGESISEQAWQTRNNVDLGALAERVSGTERGLTAVSQSLENLERHFSDQIRTLTTSIGSQNRDILSKIDQQQATFAASRATNWTAFWGTFAAIAAVAVALGVAVIAPITGDLKQVTDDVRDLSKAVVVKADFTHTTDDFTSWVANIRDRLRVDEDNLVSQRQHQELITRLDERYAIRAKADDEKFAQIYSTLDRIGNTRFTRDDGDRLERHVNAIDSDLIKRPEIFSITSALDNRINSVIGSLNELRHDYGTSFTVGDRLKGLEQEIIELRRIGAASPAPAGN